MLTCPSVIPRQLDSTDGNAPWPPSAAHASFSGPVDLDTFHLKDGIWPEPLTKTSVFVKLGSYLQPENDHPPRKGVHVCHVLIVFPVDQQPWKSLAGWMRSAANPFPRGSWIACSGRLLGVLDRELIQGPKVVDSTVRILVVLPDSWELIRQNTLYAHSTSTPKSSGPVTGSPTTPRSAGPSGITSRNPFSSPSRTRNLEPQKKTPPSPLPPKHQDHNATEPPATPEPPPNSTTVDVEPVLTISDSGMTLPSISPTQLTANEIPSTAVMVQTQSSCWKINSFQLALAPRRTGREQTLQSQSEVKDSQQGRRRLNFMTRSSGTCNDIEPAKPGGDSRHAALPRAASARSSRLPLACRERHGPSCALRNERLPLAAKTMAYPSTDHLPEHRPSSDDHCLFGLHNRCCFKILTVILTV